MLFLCVVVFVAQTAEMKAKVEAQLIRRLSQRPTKGELQDRNILKGLWVDVKNLHYSFVLGGVCGCQ